MPSGCYKNCLRNLNDVGLVENVLTDGLKGFHVFEEADSDFIVSIDYPKGRYVDEVVLEVLQIESFQILFNYYIIILSIHFEIILLNWLKLVFQ